MGDIDIIKFTVDLSNQCLKIGFYKLFSEHMKECPENAKEMMKVCRDQLNREIENIELAK